MIKNMSVHLGFLLPVAILWNTGVTGPDSRIQNGGSILGIVVPFSVKTNILVVSVSDTIAHTYSDTTNGAYILKNIPPGTYALIFVPSDRRYRENSLRATVSEDQITIADTVRLLK
jgi:hypothetical protein